MPIRVKQAHTEFPIANYHSNRLYSYVQIESEPPIITKTPYVGSSVYNILYLSLFGFEIGVLVKKYVSQITLVHQRYKISYKLANDL